MIRLFNGGLVLKRTLVGFEKRGVTTKTGTSEESVKSALTSTKKPTEKDEISNSPKPKPSNQAQDYQSQEHKHKKTIAELDEDMRLKLEGISGEGGIAGVEYEGGKAVGLKRGVKDNMFRVI